jgi:hypothetical protein
MTILEAKGSHSSREQAQQRRSYTSGTSAIPLLGLTIGDMFDQVAQNYPDHPALISRQQNIRLIYSQLQEQVNQCASCSSSAGFLYPSQPGNVLARARGWENQRDPGRQAGATDLAHPAAGV